MEEPQPRILIIDDDPIVHKLLSALLRKSHYDPISQFNGPDGITAAHSEPLDLILLDIMMPDMNGFEVIKRLKSDEQTRDIPVIFLSAKAESADKVHGLELGAADFVNKPFDRAELIARIQTQIKLKQQEEKLIHYSQNLEKMVEQRTRQLIHADRLASLGALSAGVAHEINNPTTFITGNLQTLEHFWKKMAAYVEEKMQAGDDPKIHYILQEFPDMIQSIRMGADRIADIVSGLKAFSRKDSSIKTAVDLTACLDESLKLTHNRLKYNIAIEKDLTELPPILANHQQIVQVLVNLLVNAADAIGEKDGRIVITARPGNGRVELSISDNGQGIAADVLPKVFDPFFTTKGVGEGTGLGLSITHGIIKDHQGDIQVDSRPGQGTVFRLSLPTE